ncbi:hypothetical protein Bca52824_018901 [Brassica carinata]|uniref:Uncharacterized protein n=1 Tax=Brassica carinata TaxID=52824 RepID=A0A8X7VQC1_BRACI|nr:hypothetical protein Bca52824_018901 [Brassica carinata]
MDSGFTKKDHVGGASVVMFVVCSHIKGVWRAHSHLWFCCEVASEAPEEPIHSPIAYLDWIWRGSTSTLSFATMPVWFSLYRVLLSVSSHPCHFILAPVIYFRV